MAEPDEFTLALAQLVQDLGLVEGAAQPQAEPEAFVDQDGRMNVTVRPERAQRPPAYVPPSASPMMARNVLSGDVPMSDSGPLPGQDWPQTYDPEGAARFGEIGLNALGEFSGVSSIARGYENISDPEGDWLTKGKGASQIAMGAIPGAFALRGVSRPAAAAFDILAGTIPRQMATGAPAVAADVVHDFMGPAKAGEQGFKEPTPEQIRNPTWVKNQTKRLREKRLYDGNDAWGEGVRGALKQEWEDDQKAERATRLQESQARAADAAARAATAQTEEAAAARGAAETRKKAADAALLQVTKAEEDSPYAKYIRTFAPWLLAPVGMYAGHKLAKWGADKITQGARSETDRANKLLRSDPKFNEKIGKLNQFWAEGQTAVPAAQRQNAYMRDADATRQPYWKANPNAPESAVLYPPSSKANQYVLGAALPATLGAAEMAGGYGFSHYYHGLADEADRAMRNPSATAADIFANAAHKESALNSAAVAEAFARLGMGTSVYGVPKSAFDTFMRKPMRPNVHKADEWRGDIANQIGKARSGAETAAAKQSTQPKGKAQSRGSKKPNGGSAAPLLPLGAGPLLSGERQSEQSSPRGSDASSISTDENQHHSAYQPRGEDGKFEGAPVYPKEKTKRGSDASGPFQFIKNKLFG